MNTDQGKEPKFKVGDKVRVTDTKEKVTVMSFAGINIMNETIYVCKRSKVKCVQAYSESDLSPIEEQTNLVAEGSNSDKAAVAALRSGVGNSVGQEQPPRRIRLDLMEPSELKIQEAVWEIEKIGADTRLTMAQTLLNQAKDLVSDFIDEQLNKSIKTLGHGR